MNNIFTTTADINYYDLDFRGKLKLSALLRLIHIAADRNASDMGAGFNDLSPLNMSFVIQRFGLDIARLPEYGERVTVRTWPASINSGVFVRKGDMYGADGEKVMDWESLWVLFSTESRKILKSTSLPNTFDCVNVPGVKAKAKKIRFDEDWGRVFSNYRHTVRYSEVDTNLHMNNSIYGDLTGNALFNAANPRAENWKEVQINFLSETRLGDEIDVTCRENENGLFWITGRVNGKDSFMASVTCDGYSAAYPTP